MNASWFYCFHPISLDFSNLCKRQQVYWKIPNYLDNFATFFRSLKKSAKIWAENRCEIENTNQVYWISCNFHQVPSHLYWLLIWNLHFQIEATFKKFDQTGNDKLNLREFGEMMNKRSDQTRKKSETSKKEEAKSEATSAKAWFTHTRKISKNILTYLFCPQRLLNSPQNESSPINLFKSFLYLTFNLLFNYPTHFDI